MGTSIVFCQAILGPLALGLLLSPSLGRQGSAGEAAVFFAEQHLLTPRQ